MRGTSSILRVAPVAMEQQLRKLIRHAYDEDQRFATLTMIERHLDFLNQRGDFSGAARFLAREEEAIRADAKQMRVEKRRRSLRVVPRE